MSITAPGSTNHSYYPPHIHGDTSACERTSRTKRGVADTSKRWPDGIVTVALDLKDQKSKALVVDALREWAHHTPGLQFRVVDGKEGDIRISDDEGFNGNWSAIGTDAKKIPLHEPTMHLNRATTQKDFVEQPCMKSGMPWVLSMNTSIRNMISTGKKALYIKSLSKTTTGMKRMFITTCSNCLPETAC